MIGQKIVRNPLIKTWGKGPEDEWRRVGGPLGLLATRTPFANASGTASASDCVHYFNGPRGQLPAPFIDQLEERTWQYMVWSYATPIAGVDMAGHLWIPSVTYSNTTSTLQGYCRAWLLDDWGHNFGWNPEDEEA